MEVKVSMIILTMHVKEIIEIRVSPFLIDKHDLAKMQKEGCPIRYFVTEEMKDDDVLVEIVVEEDDRKCES